MSILPNCEQGAATADEATQSNDRRLERLAGLFRTRRGVGLAAGMGMAGLVAMLAPGLTEAAGPGTDASLAAARRQRTPTPTATKAPQPLATAVIVYPKPAGAVASTVYSLTVNGQPVFVDAHLACHYAHFAFSGEATVVVTVSQAVTKHTLSPVGYGIPATVSGNRITFKLQQARKLMLWKVNNLTEKLCLFADAPEVGAPQLGAPGVVDAIVRDDIDGTGKVDSTAGIQQAINALPAGGVLYFRPGVYLLNKINLKSDMTLYLAGGAVLRVKPNATPGFEIIAAYGCNNVAIAGRGELDGNVPNANYLYNNGIVTKDTSGFRMEGIIVKDVANALVKLRNGNNLSVNNVKLIGDRGGAGGDGIDLNAVQNVSVSDCFIHSTDDAIAIATSSFEAVQDNHHITVQDCVLFTKVSGSVFKVLANWDVTQLVRTYAVRFERCHALYSQAAHAGIFSLYGGIVEDIEFAGCRFEASPHYIHDMRVDRTYGWGPAWNGKYGTVRNIRFNDCVAYEHPAQRSTFLGRKDPALGWVEDVTFRNYQLAGQKATSLASADSEIYGDNADGQVYVRRVTFV